MQRAYVYVSCTYAFRDVLQLISTWKHALRQRSEGESEKAEIPWPPLENLLTRTRRTNILEIVVACFESVYAADTASLG